MCQCSMRKRTLNLVFPSGGLNRRVAYSRRRPFTTPDALNVRPDGTLLERERGGQRPGLGKAFSAQISSSAKKIRLVNDVRYTSSGVVKTMLVTSANGELWREATEGTLTKLTSGFTLSSTSLLQSTDRLQKLYIADPASSNAPLIFDPSADTLTVWTASSGTVPTKNPILTLWRDRLVLGGDLDNPHLWYMSKAGDPLNWDYTETGVDRAVAGSTTEAGRIAEPVRAIVPHNDDCLIFFCTNSTWSMRGDPATGGVIDNLSHVIGCVDKGAWCYSPEGWLFWLSLDGIYMMPPGCGDTPISVSREQLPAELLNIDTSGTTVSMAYDVRARGIHLAITNESGAGTHYWIDERLEIAADRPAASASFWPVAMHADHEPTAIHARRSKASDDSLVMLGGKDGYLRNYQDSLLQDDGSNDISNYVFFGPVSISGGSNYFDGIVNELIATLAVGSGNVNWELRVGQTPETSFTNEAFATGQWGVAGLNQSSRPRARGTHFCVKLSGSESNTTWALEALTAVVDRRGRQRVV